jgi:UDP-N-acetylmuramoyl-tripeptide--D-alanyl-D-alanine ligase
MTALWTSVDAAAATGGRATTDWQASGVSIDTREIAPGDLFIALTAARDGHDFVADALAKGAAAAMVSRIPDGVSDDAPLLIVADVQSGLEALGAAGRARTTGRVTAITGSAGKTSTKKMLADALEGQGHIHAAARSFNNHWGVPLTLARMPEGTDVAVIEIGMNAPGEIAPLTRLTRPHVAMVTLVSAAHLEAFGSIKGIATEKAAIFEGLEPGGTAIVNGDLDTSPILRDQADRYAQHTLIFGAGKGSDWHLAHADVEAAGTAVSIDGPHGNIGFHLGTPGRHFAMNALAVLAAVDALGKDTTRAALALDGWTPPGGRGEARPIKVPGGGSAQLVDDAFNANPASMAAALDLLVALSPSAGGHRTAVLGDMLELGPDEAQLHAEIAAHPAMARIATVHCVGTRMKNLWEALDDDKRGHWTETADAMRAHLDDLAASGDVVLVKGSKGSRVSLLVDALVAAGTNPDTTV